MKNFIVRQLERSYIFMCISALLLIISSCGPSVQSVSKQGLIGATYEGPDLTRIGFVSFLDTLDRAWDDEDESQWSAKWEGDIEAPATESITFTVKTNRHLILRINGNIVAEASGENSQGEGNIKMRKGESYPMELIYMHNGKGLSFQEIKWKWGTRELSSIPKKYFTHSPQKAEFYNWRPEPDPKEIDLSQFIQVPVENVIVYKEDGHFGGWPANNGIWIWGNEIVVGFERGFYLKNETGDHSIDFSRPQKNVLARSKDGGETWSWTDPENYVGDISDKEYKYNLDIKRSTGDSLDSKKESKKITYADGINFSHPDFAMRVSGNLIFVSYDRCNTWNGPFLLADFGRELTSRTDYLVNGEKDCLFFVSVKDTNVKANLKDRSLCIRTSDGGKTFWQLGWMTGEPIEVRSVMSSTVRISENHLVSAMRRKVEQTWTDRPIATKNWIDAYESKDNGETWQFLSYVAETDLGDRNGNPPCMIKLSDGRLCVTYGYRSVLRGIRSRISSDNGKTWSKEILLRGDGGTWDLGYTRSVQRPDGKIVTIYYYNTVENPEQHIVATIWDPGNIGK